jgi:hypothetical protein
MFWVAQMALDKMSSWRNAVAPKHLHRCKQLAQTIATRFDAATKKFFFLLKNLIFGHMVIKLFRCSLTEALKKLKKEQKVYKSFLWSSITFFEFTFII